MGGLILSIGAMSERRFLSIVFVDTKHFCNTGRTPVVSWQKHRPTVVVMALVVFASLWTS